jgi:hypothetical protein
MSDAKKPACAMGALDNAVFNEETFADANANFD